MSGGLFASDATWVVGRGFFNNGIADWFDGHIDEVRISDHAWTRRSFSSPSRATRSATSLSEARRWGGRDNDPGTTTFMENLAWQGYGDDVLGYRIFGDGRTRRR
jgi:hypothetical protein